MGVSAGGREWVGPGWTRLAVRRLRSSLGGRRRRVGSGSLSPELPGPKISVFKKSFWILSICVNVQNPCKSARMHRGGGRRSGQKTLNRSHITFDQTVFHTLVLQFLRNMCYWIVICFVVQTHPCEVQTQACMVQTQSCMANTAPCNPNTALFGPNTALSGLDTALCIPNTALYGPNTIKHSPVKSRHSLV